MVSLHLSRQDASIHVQCATWPTQVTTWPWRKVKLWPWPFNMTFYYDFIWPFTVMLYINRLVLTTQTRDGVKIIHLSQIGSEEVIHENVFPEKRTFLVWPDLEGQILTGWGQIAHRCTRDILNIPWFLLRSSLPLGKETARESQTSSMCGRGRRKHRDIYYDILWVYISMGEKACAGDG